MMKRVGWVLLGVLVGAAGSAAGARADGLSGLDAKLRDTGRVGTVPPPSAGPVRPPSSGPSRATPDAGTGDRARDPRQAQVRLEADDAATEAATSTGGRTAADQEDLQRTDGAVADCRIEVARRRRVPPSKVAAGTVQLRFTIESSGRVREAEALSAVDTDLEVAACAKRVLSGWSFPKRTGDAEIVVERTYRFPRS